MTSKGSNARRILGLLSRDERGGVAILFMFVVMGLFGFVALSIDTSMWYSAKRRLQTTADAAARAGAFALERPGGTSADAEAAAREAAALNGFHATNGATLDVTVDLGAGSVHVAASTVGKMTFSNKFLSAQPRLRAQAAAAAPGSPPPCLTLLDPAGSLALDMSLGGQIVAPTCRVQVNSTSASAVGLGGGAYIKAAEICVAGGVSGTGSSVPPTTGCKPLVDPMASWTPPAVPACDHTAQTKFKSAIGLLFPGTYCGDITLQDASVVTFSPGIYYVKDATLTITDASKATGLGVAFLLSGTAKIYIDKLGQADFKAPTSGPMAGIVFAHDHTAVEDKAHKLSDGVVRYEGAIYLPRQSAKYKANAVSSNIPPFTTYIVKKIQIETGSSVLLSNDYLASDIPVVGKIGAGVVLIQ